MDNPYIKVCHVDKTLPTIVAFSSVNTQQGKFKPYRIIKNAQLNIIFVNDHDNNWYQAGIKNLSENTKISAKYIITLARDIGNGKVITLGTSMGAYGAYLYAVYGHADGCLLFGVESSLMMRFSRSLQYLNKNIDLVHPNLLDLDISLPAWLFCSEFDEIDLISGYELLNKGINVVPLQGIDHPGIQLFDIGKNIFPLILEEFANNLVMPKIWLDRQSNILDASNRKYVPILYEAYCLKKEERHSECLEKLLSLDNDKINSAIIFTKIGEAYQKTNNSELANFYWKKAIAMSDYQQEAHAKLAANLRREKKIDDAFYHIGQALKINPFCAHSHHSLGLIFSDLRQWIEAEKSFRKAISLNKGNRVFRESLIDFLNKDIDRKKKELLFDED